MRAFIFEAVGYLAAAFSEFGHDVPMSFKSESPPLPWGLTA
jgi:hypothetical protein